MTKKLLPMSAFTWATVRPMVESGKTDTQIAARFGVSATAVRRMRIDAEIDRIKLARWNAEVGR